MRQLFLDIKTHIVILTLAIAVGFVLRVWSLHTIPVGFTNDELSGIMNGYSILKTGENLSGKPWWYAMFFTSARNPMAEFHSFYSIPGLIVFGPTLLGGRIMFAVIGTLALVAMYFL
jgi:hypothetical protein